jgi:hypothetical protein
MPPSAAIGSLTVSAADPRYLGRPGWKGDYYFDRVPWERTGPGTAQDGRPRFDLTRVSPGWLERVRDRDREAR